MTPTAFRVSHVTTYRYSAEVTASQSVAHLLPRPTTSQTVQEAELRCEPSHSDRSDYTDAFGNHATYLSIEQPHATWTLASRSTVTVSAPTLPSESPSCRAVVDAMRHGALAHDVVEMALPSAHVPLDPALDAYARSTAPLASSNVLEFVRVLTERIHAEFAFDPTATELSTPVLSVLADRRGVCQDFAHLAIGCLRSVGLAARYVSGYLETDPPPGLEKLVGADASHAWIAVFVPGFGWVDADPTNGSLPAGRHITVAWGRDYADVAPSRGVVFGPPTTQQLDVEVDVTRVGR